MSKPTSGHALLSHPPTWDDISFLGAAFSKCQRIIAAVMVHRLRRAAERQLAQLDERILRDIGLDASQVTSTFIQMERLRDRAVGLPFFY